MKRFLADAFLIFILVSIGSYVIHREDSSTQEKLEKQTEQFEEDVTLHKDIKTDKEIVSLNDIEDNTAGRLAKRSSEFVVGTIQGTVEAFSTIFEGIIK